MDREFKIILPVSAQEITNEVSAKMSKRFGGVTMFPLLRGAWLKSGKLVKDDVVMLSSSRDLDKVKNPMKVLDADRKFVNNLAVQYGRKLHQDSVWTEEDLLDDTNVVKI